MNCIDLFSGIGGISLALQNYCKTILYCEINDYCQKVLTQRMKDGWLDEAPIWEDIKNLNYEGNIVDIITAGFPCQNISVAGNGKGLAGEQSGLFYEVVRVCSDIKPRWIFLENVPAITTRGGTEVVREIAKMGYDLRWCVISAASVGAMHKRERWFLLAHTHNHGAPTSKNWGSSRERIIQREGKKEQEKSFWQAKRTSSIPSNVAHSTSQEPNGHSEREEKTHTMSSYSSVVSDAKSFSSRETNQEADPRKRGLYWPFKSRAHWQEVVSGVCRMSDGVSFQVDRLRSLGNAVVPVQARTAFEILMGIKRK